MDIEKGLLLVGGASRNVGKTTFVEEIIREFSKFHSIIGLKIKTIYDDDSFFHGKDRSPLEGDYRLIEEFDKNSNEDTGKMLRAGAKKVFRLKVKSHALNNAFCEFKNHIESGDLIICESNSLRKIVQPGLFLLIKHQNKSEMKPSAKEMGKYADRVIFTDGKKHDFEFGKLRVEEGQWICDE